MTTVSHTKHNVDGMFTYTAKNSYLQFIMLCYISKIQYISLESLFNSNNNNNDINNT